MDRSKVNISRIDGLEERLVALESKVGMGYSVGQVFWSQSNLKADNPGGLPLFTGENVQAEDYDGLYNFLLRHPAIVTTKAAYDALVADTNVDCPYYAIDDGKIYLPIIRTYLNAVNVANGAVNVTPTTLYPWVSYMDNSSDESGEVLEIGFAKSNLNNVYSIDPNSAVATALAGKQDAISDLNSIRAGAAAGASALQSIPAATSTTLGGVMIEYDATTNTLEIKTS